MNVIDLLIVGTVILCFCLGLISGFVWQIAGLVSVAAGILGAIFLSPLVAGALGRWVESPELASLVAYLSVFTLLSMAVRVLAVVFSSLLKKMKLEKFDRLLGGVLGFAKGVVICAVVLVVLQHYGSARWRQDAADSMLGGLVVTGVDKAVETASEHDLPGKATEAGRRLREAAGSIRDAGADAVRHWSGDGGDSDAGASP